MLQTIEHTHNGTTYQITLFPASKGLRVLKTLLSVVGPSLGAAFGGVSGTGKEMTVNSDALGGAAQMLVENLDKVSIDEFVKDMCKGVLVGGQELPGGFDNHFAGNYGALISVLTAIIRENYSSFFGESGFGSLSALVSKLQSSGSLPKPQS